MASIQLRARLLNLVWARVNNRVCWLFDSSLFDEVPTHKLVKDKAMARIWNLNWHVLLDDYSPVMRKINR